jgi:hypothetical protein
MMFSPITVTVNTTTTHHRTITEIRTQLPSVEATTTTTNIRVVSRPRSAFTHVATPFMQSLLRVSLAGQYAVNQFEEEEDDEEVKRTTDSEAASQWVQQNKQHLTTSKTCAICLEDDDTQEDQETKETELRVCLPCEHVFHENCLMEWVKVRASCPLCRSQIG